MKNRREDLAQEYAANLLAYLECEGEAPLKRAYELAREAMAEGIGVVEMAALHHEAMIQVMQTMGARQDGSRSIITAGAIFMESLSPFEMTHRAFRESTVALRRLNEQLEEGAKRIAHALHAEAGQLLASVHVALARLSPDIPPRAREEVARIGGLLDQASDQIRRLSHELRPTILDDLGLLPALRFLAEGVSSRSSIPVSVEGELEKRLPPVMETAIYRTVQEALNNMNRHARARRAVVRVLDEPGRVVCSVEDDGRGFDSAAVLDAKPQRGLGLLGIRERLKALGGTLQVRSSPGQGTDIRVTIPKEG